MKLYLQGSEDEYVKLLGEGHSFKSENFYYVVLFVYIHDYLILCKKLFVKTMGLAVTFW